MPNTPLPARRTSGDSLHLAPTSNDRERVASFLSERFAADALSLDEFEERVAKVYRVTTRVELEALSADLSVAVPLVVAARIGVAAADSVPARGHRFAILSNLEHHSIAVVPKHLDVSALLGNVELDLRDAKFGRAETEIQVHALFGHIGITLPAGAQVDHRGSGIMGSFECPSSPRAPGLAAPVVTITGSAVFGAVEIRFADPASENRSGAGRKDANRLDRPRRPS